MKPLSVFALGFVLLAGSSCTMSYGEPQAAISKRHIKHPWRISAPPATFLQPSPGLADLSAVPRPTPSPAPSAIQDLPPSNLLHPPVAMRNAR